MASMYGVHVWHLYTMCAAADNNAWRSQQGNSACVQQKAAHVLLIVRVRISGLATVLTLHRRGQREPVQGDKSRDRGPGHVWNWRLQATFFWAKAVGKHDRDGHA